MKRYLRIICITMILLLLSSALSISCLAADTFSDVNSDRWSYQYIDTLYQTSIVNGKTDTLFKPADNVTRAEFVKILGGIAGITPGE